MPVEVSVFESLLGGRRRGCRVNLRTVRRRGHLLTCHLGLKGFVDCIFLGCRSSWSSHVLGKVFLVNLVTHFWTNGRIHHVITRHFRSSLLQGGDDVHEPPSTRTSIRLLLSHPSKARRNDQRSSDSHLDRASEIDEGEGGTCTEDTMIRG